MPQHLYFVVGSSKYFKSNNTQGRPNERVGIVLFDLGSLRVKRSVHQYGQELQFGCSRVSILASPTTSFAPLTMAPANCHFLVLPLQSGFVVRVPAS